MWISWIIIGVDPKRMRGVSPSRKQSSKLQLRVSNCLPWKIHEWFSYTKKLIVPTDPVCCPDTQMLCWMMLLLMRILSDNIKLLLMREHNPAAICCKGRNTNFIFIRDYNLAPPLKNTLEEVIASILSSYGIQICHHLWTKCRNRSK